MGIMALGYGSEFHLLRWLGRHRNEFDKRVKSLLNIENVTWLDFEFDFGDIPDKEIIGLNFLDKSIHKDIISQWKNEWPQTGNSMNWDLVGYSENPGEKTWILIEAKAHLGELEQNCGAKSPDSVAKIKKALLEAAKNNGIEILDINPWTRKFYQLANRIYVLDLLKRNNVQAKLVNIYFIGDMSSKNRKSPQNQIAWQSKLVEMKKYLNIQKLTKLEIKELFLEIDK